MSIRDEINAHLAAKRLFHLTSAFLGEDAPRDVFVSVDVAELVLHMPISGGREGRRASNARALLDGFIEGDYVTVGEDPFDKNATCIMARVDPVKAEIFDFRCLDPNPGLRILGAFSERDTFIALTWDYRENFDGNWHEKVADCQAEWRRLFGNIPRHSGANINEYISSNVRSV